MYIKLTNILYHLDGTHHSRNKIEFNILSFLSSVSFFLSYHLIFDFKIFASIFLFLFKINILNFFYLKFFLIIFCKKSISTKKVYSLKLIFKLNKNFYLNQFFLSSSNFNANSCLDPIFKPPLCITLG